MEADDRRYGRRQRILKGGRVVYGNFMFALDCALRDISDTGAQVRIGAGESVPDEFHLYINETKSLRPVQVVWRKGRDVGVAFRGEAKVVQAALDPRLKRLEFV